MTAPFSGDYAGKAYAHDQFTVSSTAKGVDEDGQTLDPFTSGLIIYTSAAIRYTIDGTTPTSSLGIPVAAGSTFLVVGGDNCNNLKMIRTSGDSTIDCVYLRG